MDWLETVLVVGVTALVVYAIYCYLNRKPKPPHTDKCIAELEKLNPQILESSNRMLGWWINFLRNVGIDPNTENLTQGLANLIRLSNTKIMNHADAVQNYFWINSALNSLQFDGTPGTQKALQLDMKTLGYYSKLMSNLSAQYGSDTIANNCRS